MTKSQRDNPNPGRLSRSATAAAKKLGGSSSSDGGSARPSGRTFSSSLAPPAGKASGDTGKAGKRASGGSGNPKATTGNKRKAALSPEAHTPAVSVTDFWLFPWSLVVGVRRFSHFFLNVKRQSVYKPPYIAPPALSPSPVVERATFMLITREAVSMSQKVKQQWCWVCCSFIAHHHENGFLED